MAMYSCPDFWSIHSNPLVENLPTTATSLQRPCFPVLTSDPFTQILLLKTSPQRPPLFNGHVFLSRLLIHSLKSSNWKPPHKSRLSTMARKFWPRVETPRDLCNWAGPMTTFTHDYIKLFTKQIGVRQNLTKQATSVDWMGSFEQALRHSLTGRTSQMNQRAVKVCPYAVNFTNLYQT